MLKILRRQILFVEYTKIWLLRILSIVSLGCCKRSCCKYAQQKFSKKQPATTWTLWNHCKADFWESRLVVYKCKHTCTDSKFIEACIYVSIHVYTSMCMCAYIWSHWRADFWETRLFQHLLPLCALSAAHVLWTLATFLKSQLYNNFTQEV